MATLVLSTAGTMLGGPIGGAIGSLIGHSIDQQLFGPGPRRGPRLGDLAVQTSSYGTPVPRIYGTMRVGGSVIWATDLKETESPAGGGKGQPATTTYSYSASFAVALSSRRVRSIKRIWADGKLLRGQAGDFKVPTVFRFYDGSEDQAIDPMIASIEGIVQTPAYRGLALAVFEDMQLAEFGNRIPFLTFEVEADAEPPTVGAILNDAGPRAIECSAAARVQGYAAHGSTIAAAIEPLVEHFGIELFDDGEVLRSPVAAETIMVAENELGNSANADRQPKFERSQLAVRTLPVSLSISYYDPARDYQTGQMQAATGETPGTAERSEIPAVLEAGWAKALAESSLARRWAKRDKLRVRLPTAMMGIGPGTTLRLPLTPELWTVDHCQVEAFVAVADLVPQWNGVSALAAEPGRSVSSPDEVAGETRLALFELPDLEESATGGPVIHLAAATAGSNRVLPALELVTAGALTTVAPPSLPTVTGIALGALAGGQPNLIDAESAIEVQLLRETDWLQSCDDGALVAGTNAAAIGSEIVQFGQAEPLGERKFRLSRLVRGRRGTEWAMPTHQPGEPFALLQPSRLRTLRLDPAMRGASIIVRTADGSVSVSHIVTGESLRPPSPVKLKAVLSSAGDLESQWVRRSRSGWAWLDETDAPLGEMQERYRVRLTTSQASFEVETSEQRLVIAASDLVALGSGPATLSVRQMGDRALSHPAEIALILP